jgi:hypothetical protein
MPKFYKWKFLDYASWYFAHMVKEHFIDVRGNNGLKEIMSYKGFGMRDHIQVIGPITY